MVIQEAFPGAERVKSFVPLGVERPQHLSAADISQFNEKGYICPLDVFSPRRKSRHNPIFRWPARTCPGKRLEQLRIEWLAFFMSSYSMTW